MSGLAKRNRPQDLYQDRDPNSVILMTWGVCLTAISLCNFALLWLLLRTCEASGSGLRFDLDLPAYLLGLLFTIGLCASAAGIGLQVWERFHRE